MIRPIDTVERTIMLVRLRQSIDDEVNHSQTQDTGISKQVRLRVGERLGMELPGTLQNCVYVLRTNHANAPY